MKPIKVGCTACGGRFRVGAADAGKSTGCPQCGALLAIPFPGIGRSAFLGYHLLMFVFAVMLIASTSGASGDTSAIALVLLPVGLIAGIGLAIQRGVNIGHEPGKSLLIGLIPLSIFYFLVKRTGSVPRK